MKPETQGTPAAVPSEGSARPSKVPPDLEVAAHAQWRRSFCGPSCPCDECAYNRAASRASVEPSFLEIDMSDPVFLATFRRALQAVDGVEAVRRLRTAHRMTLEWMRRRA